MWNDSNSIDRGVKYYFTTLSKVKPLTKKEERKLLIDYKTNHNISARNALIKSNLRYACKVASSYRGSGINFSDLISEANDGLMEAIDRFDLSKDVKLISYAKWWIQQRLSQTVENRNRMRVSEIPSDSTFNGGEWDDVSTASDAFLVDDTSTEETDNADRMAFVQEILKGLSDRERDVVNMYFGRGYDKEYTMEEIGHKYNITKERTRQILEGAFKKVRCEAVTVGSRFLTR